MFLSLDLRKLQMWRGNPIEAYFNRYYEIYLHPIITIVDRLAF